MSESVGGATELPVADTVDVRSGPEVSEELLAVLPLLGEWHGEGQAAGAGGDHRFGQWIRFSHDGHVRADPHALGRGGRGHGRRAAGDRLNKDHPAPHHS